MQDINGAASKLPQISDMFQKLALAFKDKTFESDDEKAGGDSSDGFARLDSTEVITGQKVVVIKRNHCRAAPVEAQSRLPEPNLWSVETLGRKLERACGLSQESTRLAKKPWRERSCVSGKMNSGERERGREASHVGPIRATWGHASIFEWFALLVMWKGRSMRYFFDKKAFQTFFLYLTGKRNTFFLKSHFDFLSQMPGRSFAEFHAEFVAAFVAPVFLSMIAYEDLHGKKASKCEVFLSFSGEDALKNFVDSLYKGMVDAGICVLRNDYCLHQHQEIGFQAIESSKISIPILSPKYVSSGRCLDELVQIMKCKNDSLGHVAWPIFYRLKAADVRCKIDVCGPKVMEKRGRALAEISSLKGWESDKITDGYSNLFHQNLARFLILARYCL